MEPVAHILPSDLDKLKTSECSVKVCSVPFRSPAGASVPLYETPPMRELREGEVMGAYMEFDRTADKSWSPATYLIEYGLYVSKQTVKANRQ